MPNFLIDENLSPRLAVFLRSLHYHAVAVRDVGLRSHPDTTLLTWAKSHRHVIVTRDVEFAEMAFGHARGQIGVILLRTLSQQARAHEAVLQRLHRQGFLRDERLDGGLLVATPSTSRLWS